MKIFLPIIIVLALPAWAAGDVCPSSPNCVSSDARDSSHQVASLQLAVAPAEAWRSVREAVSELPRSRIVNETPNYLHAECRSALFGFVDDLELQLRADEGVGLSPNTFLKIFSQCTFETGVDLVRPGGTGAGHTNSIKDSSERTSWPGNISPAR